MQGRQDRLILGGGKEDGTKREEGHREVPTPQDVRGGEGQVLVTGLPGSC